MRIYIDFDDCLCETARMLAKEAREKYGRNVPYEDMRYFDLKKSFSFNDEEYDEFMVAAHYPETLISLEETPGASEVIWLDNHNLERVKLFFLDKYSRDEFYRKGESNLSLEDFYKMDFDYAIEDSPNAFRFFDSFSKLKVMVFSRPWNLECELPGENYTRCTDWKMIKNLVR